METRSAQEIWDAALGELQIQVSKPNYRTWLEKTIGLSYQDNQFVVGVPTSFVAEYLDKNQYSLIEKTLIGLTTTPEIKVSFQVNGKHQSSLSTRSADWKNLPSIRTDSPIFKSNYVFDSFIVGSCNHLAYAAAQAVTQNPGYSYNPLFICGGVGLGKTHLLHAIGHAALANNIKVIYVTAEQFTNEFVNAIRERKTDEFRDKYRSSGMLLVDDIHFISGKEQTAESFFHTFNALHNANRQIVITSDQPPKSMPFLEERLRSRFEWGLIVDIQPPEFETRLAILQSKAKQREVNITSDVLELIARQIRQNIRELEGSLNRVIAYARLLRASPDIELATHALKDIVSKEPKGVFLTSSQVLKAVADSFQMEPVDLKGRKRDRGTTLARQVAMYLIRQETNYSLAQIGKELGNRDHHLVSQAHKKIASDMTTDRGLNNKILDIQQRLHSRNR